MDWQMSIVVVLIAAAAVYVGRTSWRTWLPPKGQCGGGCGCHQQATNKSDALIPSDQLTVRLGNKGDASNC
jgi:hypothetical protein